MLGAFVKKFRARRGRCKEETRRCNDVGSALDIRWQLISQWVCCLIAQVLVRVCLLAVPPFLSKCVGLHVRTLDRVSLLWCSAVSICWAYSAIRKRPLCRGSRSWTLCCFSEFGGTARLPRMHDSITFLGSCDTRWKLTLVTELEWLLLRFLLPDQQPPVSHRNGFLPRVWLWLSPQIVLFPSVFVYLEFCSSDSRKLASGEPTSLNCLCLFLVELAKFCIAPSNIWTGKHTVQYQFIPSYSCRFRAEVSFHLSVPYLLVNVHLLCL